MPGISGYLTFSFSFLLFRDYRITVSVWYQDLTALSYSTHSMWKPDITWQIMWLPLDCRFVDKLKKEKKNSGVRTIAVVPLGVGVTMTMMMGFRTPVIQQNMPCLFLVNSHPAVPTPDQESSLNIFRKKIKNKSLWLHGVVVNTFSLYIKKISCLRVGGDRPRFRGPQASTLLGLVPISEK